LLNQCIMTMFLVYTRAVTTYWSIIMCHEALSHLLLHQFYSPVGHSTLLDSAQKAQVLLSGHSGTIHWMPVSTQLWMNLNRVVIWFQLGNQFCKK